MLPAEIKKFITDHPTVDSYTEVVCSGNINLDPFLAKIRWDDIKRRYDQIIHNETMQAVASINA
jgi:hypothetical protein